jgi:hypothetical protein
MTSLPKSPITKKKWHRIPMRYDVEMRIFALKKHWIFSCN